MLSKLFKKTKKEVTKSNIEKLNNNELKNVVGGTDTESVIATTTAREAFLSTAQSAKS